MKPLEVYRQKLVLYGCGDFINDYEGISGYEAFRDDLCLMFLPSVDPASGQLVALRLTPMQIRRLRLNRPSGDDARWLRDTLNRVSQPFGVRCELQADGALTLASPSLESGRAAAPLDGRSAPARPER